MEPRRGQVGTTAGRWSGLLRWLLADTLDPQLPIGLGERLEIHQDAKFRATGEWRTWAASGVLVAVFLPIFLYGIARLTRGSVALGLSLLIAAMALVIIGGWVLARWLYAPFMRRAARRRGYDVCIGCGYWLRGLSDNIARCPECGAVRLPLQHEAPTEVNQRAPSPQGKP